MFNKVKLFIFCLFMLGATGAQADSLSVLPSSPLTGSELYFPGYPANQNTYQAYLNEENLAANGIAPTVSSTISGYPGIHEADNLNDGFYGNGASWISGTSNSWIQLDLGDVYAIDTVAFGRDRLGYFTDRGPGQFWIETSSDGVTYISIFDSSDFGFPGTISRGTTLYAEFSSVDARYVKITFQNAGVAIDEVEVFGAVAIPEPSSVIIALLGMVLIGLRSRLCPRKSL